MNRSTFRRFEFFEVETLAENVTTNLGGKPTCAIADGGMLFFGDEMGNLIISDRNFQLFERKYKLFRGEIRGIQYVFDHVNNHLKQYLFVIGDDSKANVENMMNDGLNIPVSSSPHIPVYVIKVFSLQDMTHPLTILNATFSNDASLTSFSVLGDGMQIVAGFSNGAVLLFTGNFLKESVSSNLRPIPPTILMMKHKYPVSNTYLCDLSPNVNKQSMLESRKIRLFVVYDNQSSISADNAINPLTDNDPLSAGILIFDTSMTFTPQGVYVLNPLNNPNSPKNLNQTQIKNLIKILDERGISALNCSFMKNTYELVVNRNEAIYNYSIDDIGGALAIFGEKLALCCMNRYTLVVSIEDKNNNNPSSFTSKSSLESSIATTNTNKPKRPTINIYDLKNKIICGTNKKYYLALNEKVSFISNDASSIYILTSNFALIRFREKDTNSKLEVLLNGKPPLYSLAIMLAAEEQVEASEIMKLYKLYGDHLYKKNEFDAAVTQYSHTIGYVPPSYVVMKFLDPYRINNLIFYLEKLYDKGLATKDHVMLQLTCYTKIKEETKLTLFLQNLYSQHPPALLNHKKSSSSAETKSGLGHNANPFGGNLGSFSSSNNNKDPFSGGGSTISENILDASAAIQTLNEAGYMDLALKLAVQYYQHEAYIRIQLSKSPVQYDNCLAYLTYLTFISTHDELLFLIKRYGSQLLQHRAKLFTAFLIKLTTADYVSLLPNNANVNLSSASNTVKYSVGSTRAAVQQSTITSILSVLLGGDGSTFDLPAFVLSVVDVISLYKSHPNDLLILLEGYVEMNKSRLIESKISMTMLELYLGEYFYYKTKIGNASKLKKSSSKASLSRVSSSHDDYETSPDTLSDPQEIQKKLIDLDVQIMSILDSGYMQYDPSQAMLLTNIYSYERGYLFLLDKQNAINTLLSLLIEQKDTKEVFKILRRDGGKDSDLYVQILTHFVDQTKENKIRMEGIKESLIHSTATQSSEYEMDNSVEYDSDDEYERWKHIIEVMDMIEKESVLSPIQVVTILSRNPEIPLFIASSYLNKAFRETTDNIQQTESDIKSTLVNLESYVNLTHAQKNLKNNLALKMRQKILRQKKKSVSVKSNPFSRGLEEEDDEDADYDDDYYDIKGRREDTNEEGEEGDEEMIREIEMQVKEQTKWNAIRKAQIDCSNDHETFYKELEQSTDGFRTVSNYFGRSIIS